MQFSTLKSTVAPATSGFPGGIVVNKAPMQETQETGVQSLGRKDLLKKEIATCCSIFAWEILWTEEPGRLQSTGSQKSWTQLRD